MGPKNENPGFSSVLPLLFEGSRAAGGRHPNERSSEPDRLGGGRGRVYPPHTPSHRSFSAGCWHSWNALRSLDPSKSSGKTNGFSTVSILGPIKPPHIPITLAI